MITLNSYRDTLKKLADGDIFSRPIVSLLTDQNHSGLFIKHDVEANVDRAVRMAKAEQSLGHKATYYFQGDFLDHKQGRAAIKAVHELGHEVAYHYDVLDENDGDYDKSLIQFQDYVNRFADIGCTIQTVCPHGNPTKIRDGWSSNKDFFRSQMVRDAHPDMLDIVIDFPKLFDDGIYISDAGYKLRRIGEIATNDKSNDTAMQDGVEIKWNELSGLTAQHQAVVLSIHPHRIMASGFAMALQKGIFRVAKTTYMVLRRIPLISTIVNKFYKLSRRI